MAITDNSTLGDWGVSTDRDDVNLLVVTGPTAGGKTAFAARLADAINGEIISADSRQVYRSMDIGTGKDYADYTVAGKQVPFHLIDIREPGYKYNVYEFQIDFLDAFRAIHARGRMPLLAGGTGLYIQAVLEAYELTAVPVNAALRRNLEHKNQSQLIEMLRTLNQKLHNTTDTVHRKRTIRAIEIASFYRDHPDIESEGSAVVPVLFGVKYDRPAQRKKISERLMARLNGGMVQEVQGLLKRIPEETLIYYGLEYKYITQHLRGRLAFEEMHKKLETAIHQFAKRQMTWFRKMERQGYYIHWLDAASSMEEKLQEAKKILSDRGLLLKTH